MVQRSWANQNNHNRVRTIILYNITLMWLNFGSVFRLIDSDIFKRVGRSQGNFWNRAFRKWTGVLEKLGVALVSFFGTQAFYILLK